MSEKVNVKDAVEKIFTGSTGVKIDGGLKIHVPSTVRNDQLWLLCTFFAVCSISMKRSGKGITVLMQGLPEDLEVILPEDKPAVVAEEKPKGKGIFALFR